MPEQKVLKALGNLDSRLTAVEQLLPNLPTRQDLAQAISQAVAPLATREELAQAIAPLATREELAQAIAPLATRDELREEGERSRRYTQVLFEDLKDDIRLLSGHLLTLSGRVDALARR